MVLAANLSASAGMEPPVIMLVECAHAQKVGED